MYGLSFQKTLLMKTLLRLDFLTFENLTQMLFFKKPYFGKPFSAQNLSKHVIIKPGFGNVSLNTQQQKTEIFSITF